jgi:hypothetical protein
MESTLEYLGMIKLSPLSNKLIFKFYAISEMTNNR